MNKFLILGTGQLAIEFVENLESDKIFYEFIQSVSRQISFFGGQKVYSPDKLPENYSYIIVANSFSDDVYKLCVSNEISLDKVFYEAGRVKFV